MLKRQILFYEDGRKTDEIIYVDGSSPTIIYPQRDGIKHGFLTHFKYKVTLNEGEILAIIRFPDETILMPKKMVVHPKTTLDDVEVTIRKSKKEIKQEPTLHTFKSSSSDSVYTVREVAGTFKCNCPGSFRSKDKKCKHIKSLEK